MSMPLTGRMQVQTKNARWLKHIRNRLTGALLLIFGTTVVFICFLSVSNMPFVSLWENSCHYSITPTTTSHPLISTSSENQLEKISGAEYILCSSEMEIGLSVSDEEDEISTHIEVLKQNNWWSNMFEFGEDSDAFWNGDIVLMYFRSEDFTERYGDEWAKDSAFPQEKVTLRAYDAAGNLLTESTAVACVRYDVYAATASRTFAVFANEPYTIVCSDAYFQKMLAGLAPDVTWNGYGAKKEYGHLNVSIRLNSYAMTPENDRTVATFCSENTYDFFNKREQIETSEQETVQSLLLIWFSGGCIILATLLLLTMIFSMEAEQDKRSFGTLRAIGMSARQMKTKLLCQALRRGFWSLITGLAIYIFYRTYRVAVYFGGDEWKPFLKQSFVMQWEVILSFAAERSQLFTVICLICLLVPFALTMFAKRKLWKGELEL
jgi:hypothetical protein